MSQKIDPIKKRAAAYVRVSTEEQTEGWSLDGQEKQIREFAEREGYEIVQVYRDETSGSKDKRQGLDRMLLDAHAGLFQAIIVLHSSRFFRNVALARRYKDLLRNKLGIEVLFVHQPNPDPADPMAFMVESINELFDEYYLHQLRFWTSLGKQTRAQQGLWNGTLPFGYITDKDGVPIPHPENAQGLKMAFEAYSTGRYSDREIAELLNREGYLTTGNWGERKFTKDTINRVLKNEFYLGYTKYKGELYPGQHPALIEKELFDKCQEVRARRRKHSRALGQTRRVYIFSGLLRCHECGLTLRAYSTNSKGKWRYYRHTADERGYECSVPTMSVKHRDILEQWEKIIFSTILPDDWRKRIEELAGNADEQQAVLRERNEIQERLRRLKRLYKDLLIEDFEYRAEYEQLQRRLSSLVLPSSPHLVRAGEYLEGLSSLWQAATEKEKRDITKLLVIAIYVDVEQSCIVAVEPKAMFRILIVEICESLEIKVI